MSEEETKRQEEATQDKQSTSTKATSDSKQKEASNNNKNNEELIIEQVRSELETYFAPQNIQNDFNLRQKMTTDGYIDIDLLLDLKLISDLVSNREILIEAISRSKLLVMNTGCTMVKYMPLLERNVLILRDIPTSIKKEQIITIFTSNTDNGCSIPSEVHSDIGNNWFCQFKTEEECLKTAKYLQQFGTFNNEKLHVRVKAIHDTNKSDHTPQSTLPITSSPKTAPIIPPQPVPQYPQGYYQNQYAYYGAGPGPAGPPPMDPYYGYGAPAVPPRQDKRNKKRKPDQEVADAVVDEAVVTTGGKDVAEERTAISDYPGVFDKYSVQEFLDIYKGMKVEEVSIPQSMRGRDFRIISEGVLIPDALVVRDEAVDEDEDDDDEKDYKTKGKGKGKGKRRGKKKEVSGTYYEDGGDVYDGGDYEYEEEEEYDDNKYYYGQQSHGGYSRYYNRQYNRNYNRNKYYYGHGGQRGGYNRRRGGGYQGGRQYRRGGGGGGGGAQYKPKGRGRGTGSSYSRRGASSGADTYNTYNTSSGKHWSAKQAKQYSTNKGVYRTKTSQSNNAY